LTHPVRRALAIGLSAVLATDVAVALVAASPAAAPGAGAAAGPTSIVSLRAGHPASAAERTTSTTASVVPPAATATASHKKKKKKPPPTVTDSVLGLVGAIANGSSNSGGSRGGGHPKHGGRHGNGSPRHGSSGRSGSAGRMAPRRDLQYIPSYTVLATLKKRAPGFASAHSTRRAMTVPKSWYGYTTTMPVIAQTATRVKVRLARRPDESTIWIRKRAATFTSTTYALLVDISKRHIYLFRAGRQVGSYPVGVGLPQTPTPTGNYFIAFHAPPNGPGYGAVMLETSAHSKVFRTFEGGNDAIIAIHGPITAQSDHQIGKNGTRISNGCIRMHDRQLLKVAKVPDGTPLVLAP
jgi:hypothetical protein